MNLFIKYHQVSAINIGEIPERQVWNIVEKDET